MSTNEVKKMFRVEINQVITDIVKEHEVFTFVKELGLEFEPNVKLWGLRETIQSSGRACLYEIGDESDTVAGDVTLV